MKLSHFKKDQKTQELSSLRDKITKTASFEIHERMIFNHHVMNICFAVSDGFPFSPTTHIGRSSAKDLCQPRPHPSRSHRLVPNLPKVEETTNLALPVIAFPSRNCHTAVITGLYSVPKGPWVLVYRFFR